jgi:uncharacterized protein
MNTQLLTDHLALIGKDLPAWIDLFAEDAVVEYPYAAALNSPARLEGKSAIYSYITEAIAQMENLVFTNVCEYKTLNPNVLLAEVHGEADIIATGRHYQQDYVMRLETKDGKIVHYREYWNPVPFIEAMGGTESLHQSLNFD